MLLTAAPLCPGTDRGRCTVLALAAENRSLEEVFLALTEKEQEAPAEGEEKNGDDRHL